MTPTAIMRFIADEIIRSVSAAEIDALCDRLAQSEVLGSDDQAAIARELREMLEAA